MPELHAAGDNASLPSLGGWAVEGQLLEASNIVLRMRLEPSSAAAANATTDLDAAKQAARAVYKPIRGERPLSDFPLGTLAHREVATSIVARSAGWSCVPDTQWFDGEFGPGSLQRWVGPLEGSEPAEVFLLPESELDPAHAVIAAFETPDNDEVFLTHRRSEQLRVIALLDVICNNADRKGSHLITVGETVYAIDNGLTFHTEDKLRTVLWGFAAERLNAGEIAALRQLKANTEPLTLQLKPHLAQAEIEAFWRRVDDILAEQTFPEPPGERYGLPWPPL